MTNQSFDPVHPVVGVVDVGSNSIKLTVATRDSFGKIIELITALETVRLGSGLGTTGRLSDDRIQSAIDALRDFASIARDHGATELIGIATEATRQAANGEEFLVRVRLETGWDVAAIDGDREADLTFRGVASLGNVSGLTVIADIGGGSTELIEAEDGIIVEARSLPIGSGTLTDAFLTSDPPTEAEIAAAADDISARLNPYVSPHNSAPRMIAVGGTAEYLARLVGRGALVAVVEIDLGLEICLSTPSDELANLIDIPAARARVLPAGIVVIRELTAALGVSQVEVAASGIRTGLLLETFDRLRNPTLNAQESL